MRKLRAWVFRLGGLFNKHRKDSEFDSEIESHLQLHIEDNLRLGLSPKEARLQALIKLGGIDSTQEAYRDQRSIPQLETVWQDIRYGARMLRKNPSFTAVAVLTLALGIGGNTAIFSLVNAALLRQLPFRDADQLVAVWAGNPLKPGSEQLAPANADIAEWRAQSNCFASIAAFAPGSADLTDGGEPERIGASRVTAGFFETLGVAPLLGRGLTVEEEAPGGPPVVLISHGLWQRRFGGDRALLGSSISVNGEKRTVIGILPPEFDFPRASEWPSGFSFADRTEVWLPLAYRALDDGTGWSNWQSRNERGLAVVGRIKAGIGTRQAQAEMDAFAASRAQDHPETHKDVILKLIPLGEQLAGKSRQTLVTLFGAAGFLLLITCVNVANLLLARGVARQGEMALRSALGAGRERLAGQLLTEGVLMALLGSGFGILFAALFLKTFLALSPLAYSRLNEASLDPVVLGYTALIALATSALFGLAPALQAARFDLRKSIDEGGRTTGGLAPQPVRSWLVAIQVAFALVLLTTAGLMLRSFVRVLEVQPGFRSDSLLAFNVQTPAGYPGETGPTQYLEELTGRFEALPGVRSAGAISYLPLSGGENRGRFTVEGEPPIAPGDESRAERRWVTPGYFATMRIPIQKGRTFTKRDSIDQPKVVVINETMARQFFTAGDSLGRKVSTLGHWRTVVGVVADVKSASLERNVAPQIYLPHAQDPWPPMTMVLHTEGDPLALAAAVRSELKRLAPLAPVTGMRTMDQVMANAASARRFNVVLLGFFSISALLLTTLGIYGVVSFLVGRRQREIGIRMALGAQRGNALGMVLRQGMRPVVAGSVVGLVGSLAASRLVANQLFGVSPTDPLTLTTIIALLLLAALMACWVPARRAVMIDPMVALRCE